MADVTNTPYQVDTTTPVIEQCKDRWLPWLNRVNPQISSGDHELMTPLELSQACDDGFITDIECVTVAGTSYDVTGEMVTCDLTKGLSCSNSNLRTCLDYKVRYRCECEKENVPRSTSQSLHNSTPTPAPGSGSFGTPTPVPGSGSFGTPTPAPGSGSFGTPTPAPGSGSFGTPTPAPGSGSFGTPTPAPGSGNFGTPTPAPGSGSFGTPTPAPVSGNFGTPTPAPGSGSFDTPTPAPGSGSFGTPTPAPGSGSFSSPTPAPGFGSFGTPTPAPGSGSFGTPTPAPGSGSFESPTPAPGSGSFGSPTPAPGSGSFGTPTPAPGSGSFGTPTPAPPGSGSFGTPTPAPGSGNFGTPTPAPGSGSFGTPSPAPGSGSFDSPTPAPGLRSFGTPTPAPGSGSFGTPTPAPGSGNFGTPTPAPGSGSFGTPTPAPGSVSFGTPSPAPGSGSFGTPTPAPGSVNFGTPTPAPGSGNFGTPTPAPGSGSFGTPTPTPGSGSFGTSTPAPGSGSFGNPTPAPGSGNFGTPTPAPGSGSFGTPTPAPGSGSFATPTPAPGSGSFGTPTPAPGSGSFGTPTPAPGSGSFGTPTPAPGSGSFGTPSFCVTSWSPWINRDTPATNDGDYEKMTAEELASFCPGGQITDIQCVDSDSLDDWSSLSQASCTVEEGLQCINLPFFDSPSCRDYKIRYMCNCSDVTQRPEQRTTGTPTPSPGSDIPGTPTLTPRSSTTVATVATFISSPTPSSLDLCVSGWSSWINRDTPATSDGDYEKMTAEELASFCPGGQITDIQCVDSDSLDDWSSLSQASCTVEEGLQCINLPFFDSPSCRDYKIRYMCNCSDVTPYSVAVSFGTTRPAPRVGSVATPTPSTDTGSSSTSSSTLASSSIQTPATAEICVSNWSPWTNRDTPASDSGDFEKMTAEELASFCPGGQITDIQCVDSDSLDDWSSLSQASCTVEEGLQCINLPFFDSPSCRDYKIRYMCNCSDSSTKPPLSATTQPSKIQVDCAWSPWLNADKPDVGVGDIESISEIKRKYGVCPTIVDIECKVAGTPVLFSQSGQDRLTCDILNGFRCYNNEQSNGKCMDYEVRVLCWESLCPGPSPNPPTMGPLLTTLPSDQAVRTTASCPPGEEWLTCAYTCDEVCDYMGRSAGGCNGILTPEANCVPGCRPPPEITRVTCRPEERLIDTNTCVPKGLCTCLKPDGTPAKAFENWADPQRPCSVCSCFNGVGGDLEILSSVGPTHGLCAKPSRIMCRDVQTGLEASDSGQVVSCDLVDGFKCFDYKNREPCHDYEISVYCGCLPTPAPTEGTENPPTPSPGFGDFGTPIISNLCVSEWSPWINRDTPATNDGDYEKMTAEELASFCPGGQITDIQCVDSDSLDDWSSLSQASCTVEEGLQCINLPFFDSPSCRDYKIRYMCNCSEPKCDWTPWMSSQQPGQLGEEETISMLRADHTFCSTVDITAVQCRDVATKKTSEELGQASVICDLQFEGLKCFNKDQPNSQCADYEVRFFCEPRGVDCGANSVTTTSPQPPAVTLTPGTLRVCNGSVQDAMPIPMDASQITASSSLSVYSGAERAMLDTRQETLKTGGWVAQTNDLNQWIEVSFPESLNVMGLVVQGRAGADQWVESFRLMYSEDGQVFKYIEDSTGQPQPHLNPSNPVHLQLHQEQLVFLDGLHGSTETRQQPMMEIMRK
ncbi:LOW QUALITY PROTEIN: mucin-2-like [Plakobranchus ocellatus]|uniref:Mucin-2-like n=1 Tax=Plakobranchus ocellatus TaxID=259542 RepID=A0AAV3XZS9_9GAST|nr:LOW QUALITY PROTEIN: mucin-2-like [Plakobranchus ocellatus]